MKTPTTALTIRALEENDLPEVGSILYRAFNEVFTAHGHPPPVPSLQAGISLARAYAEYEPEGCWIALRDSRIVGSAFTHSRGETAGVGPVTVAPDAQNQGIGRALMEHLLVRLADCRSIRLFQDAFNRGSFALYASLAFEPRDVMAVLRATFPAFTSPSSEEGRIRPMKSHDLPDVTLLDAQLTGIVRPADILFLFNRGPAFVLEDSLGSLNGFAMAFRSGEALFVGPAAARTSLDVVRLVARVCYETPSDNVTVRAFGRPGELMERLLEAGFQVRSLGTYMVRGAYEAPKGVQLSALFPEAL